MLDVRDLVDRVPPVPFRYGGRDPSTGVDCFWAAMEVQRRMGSQVPAEADLQPPQDSGGLEEWLRRAGGFWPEVPLEAPRMLGDVLLWREGAGPGLHVLAVVDASPGRVRGLTAGEDIGLRVLPATIYQAAPTSAHRFRH